MPLPALSVLDLATVVRGATAAQALGETTELARLVESLGYRRLWVAEHHAMPSVASSAPAVLLSHLAAVTSSIRLGSGGVMLPNHAPLVVAEQFGTLEALHPGRIDLGLGRAPGTDLRTARALRRNDPDRFPEDVVELIGYFTGAGDQPAAMPGRGNLPEIWLLGSSVFGAQLAGLLGLPYAFAYHFSPQFVDAALSEYRASFRPSRLLQEPHVMVAASVLCAPSEDEARWLSGPQALSTLFLRTNRLGPLPSPEEAAAYRYSPGEHQLVDAVLANHIVGEPTGVVRALQELAARTGADELMVTTRAFDWKDRARSFELVAEAWGPAGGAAPGAGVA